VLATQQQTSQSIRSFSANLARIGAQLRDSNGDISTLLTRTRPALTEANGLINDIRGSFHGLLTDLLTTSRVFLTNKAGLQELLVKLPQAVTAGSALVTSRGINVGLVPTFFDPLPCTTGYGGTDTRSGLDTAGNPALNTKASCTAPAGSGTDVRGAQNAPGGR
jgi:phospholipid/cholesterol/gamma-HCH transport system substrate-binding protein